MKYSYLAMLIISACFFRHPAAAQQKRYTRSVPPPPPFSAVGKRYHETDNDCYPRHRYPLTERLLAYPFNKATRIAIASFRTPTAILLPADSLNKHDYGYDYATVPDGKDPLNNARLEEVIFLDEVQLDSLTSLLYNYDYRKISDVQPPVAMPGCYAPHNAILFYNDKNEIFAFIELCFTCEGMRESDEEVDTGARCNGKFDLLKSFFRKNNIIIGITQIPMVPLLEPVLK